MINFFINQDYMKIKDLREYRLLKFLKKRISTIFLTRIVIPRIITKILFIKIFIYIIKIRNNFTMRIKKFLLRRTKVTLKITKLILYSYS